MDPRWQEAKERAKSGLNHFSRQHHKDAKLHGNINKQRAVYMLIAVPCAPQPVWPCAQLRFHNHAKKNSSQVKFALSVSVLISSASKHTLHALLFVAAAR